MMFDIALLAHVLAGAVLWRIVLSRPPRRGVPGGLAAIRLDQPSAPPAEKLERLLPPPALVLGAPPALPLEPTLARAPRLPVPPVAVSVIGIEVDAANDERQLWLLARERLERRTRQGD
jgi:hypothetical protein